jgi:hypothetical protein
MRLIYTPEDGEKREFEFVPHRLLSPDAEALEGVGGGVWESLDEFGRLFLKGNRRAFRAALWLMLRAEQPKLRFQHLVVRADELDYDLDEDEQKLFSVQLEDPTLDEEDRTALDPKVGKAPMPDSGSGTDSL